MTDDSLWRRPAQPPVPDGDAFEDAGEPTIELETACVVEIGMPKFVAPLIDTSAPMLAARPEARVIFVILSPIVSMIDQPP